MCATTKEFSVEFNRNISNGNRARNFVMITIKNIVDMIVPFGL